MKRASIYYITLFLALCMSLCTVSPTLAQSQTTNQQVTVEDVRTLALLQKMQATYKAMRSYSVRITYTREKTKGTIASPVVFDLYFARPNHLAIRRIGPVRRTNWTNPTLTAWEQYRFDGTECILLPSLRSPYARFPLEGAGTAFGLFSGYQLPLSEMQWLGALFSPEDLLTGLWRAGYERVSQGVPSMLDGIAVQTVIARTKAKGQRPPSELIFTIGTDDYRLYRTQRIEPFVYKDSVETIKCHALQVDPLLDSSLFVAPADRKSLCQMDVLEVAVERIILSNKEQKAQIGDHVFLFQGDGFNQYVTGELVITKVNKGQCEAEALSLVSIRPGHHGFLVSRTNRMSTNFR